MKQQEHPAVAAFKSRVDRAEEAMLGFGYQVKRTHLMDVIARAEGERSWKHYKAKLANTPVQRQETQPGQRQAYEAPKLQGKLMHLIVSAYIGGEEEAYAYLQVDQKMADYLSGLMGEQILAIASTGSGVRSSGSLPMYWFSATDGYTDVSRVDFDDLGMSYVCMAPDERWGNAMSQGFDLAEVFEAIEVALANGGEFIMHVDDLVAAKRMLELVAMRPEMSAWQGTFED